MDHRSVTALKTASSRLQEHSIHGRNRGGLGMLSQEQVQHGYATMKGQNSLHTEVKQFSIPMENTVKGRKEGIYQLDSLTNRNSRVLIYVLFTINNTLVNTLSYLLLQKELLYTQSQSLHVFPVSGFTARSIWSFESNHSIDNVARQLLRSLVKFQKWGIEIKI